MDWGNSSPAGYTIIYILVTAAIQGVLLFVLALVLGVGPGADGLGGLSGPIAVVGLALVLTVPSVYVLFALVNSLISDRIQEYHRRSHGLPAPANIEESDLTELESVDRDTAGKLFESGYKSTDHIDLVDAGTIGRESGIGQRLADEIKKEARRSIPEESEDSEITDLENVGEETGKTSEDNEITDLENVDEETAKKLKNSGYRNIKHLKDDNHTTIARKSGIDKHRAGIIKEEVINNY